MPASLTALRTFEVAARNGSFKRAAAELNLSATAISHQIRSLEKALGLRLFDREVRRVSLTPEGEELARVLTPAFGSIRDVVERIQGRSQRHTVTLGAGPIFASRWLVPKLGKLWLDHPDIDLRLHHSPLPVHRQMARYDIAVAWITDDMPLGELRADLLMRVEVSPVLAPRASFHDGRRLEPDDVLSLPLLHHRDKTGWQVWLDMMGVKAAGPLPGTVFEDANVQLQAVLDGQGIGMGFLPLIADDIEAGRLIQPWRETVTPPQSYHVLHKPEALDRQAVEQVRDWLLSFRAGSSCQSMACQERNTRR